MIYNAAWLLAKAGGGESNPTATFIMMGALMVIMYFFFIRPQTKKQKEQKQFIDDVAKGDKIVTIGGIHARVIKVNEDSLLVEVDTNTKLKIDKSVISLEMTKELNKGS